MGTKRKRGSAGVVAPDALQELHRLVCAALEALQLPLDALTRSKDSENVVSNTVAALGLDKLKRVPKLHPPGCVFSSDVAVRLFFSLKKAGVMVIASGSTSDKTRVSSVDSPQKLAELCVEALRSELHRRTYRHVVRVWLPQEREVEAGVASDRILVQIREFAQRSDEVEETLLAQLPLTVIFRDDAIMVVSKPANVLSVDGTDPDAPLSVHRCIANMYPEARMVHRLDQETSGLLVIALTKSAAQSLNAQFRDRSVHKTYVARVLGWLEDANAESSTRVVRVPMEKHPSRQLVQRVVTDRDVEPDSVLWSVTEYSVLSRTTEAAGTDDELKSSLVELKPVTGKTHQLRLHMKYLGHPILGDSLYSPDLVYHRATRLCLHAAKLSFAHPVTGEQMEFESPHPTSFFNDEVDDNTASHRPPTVKPTK